ncbi:hypothetical protein [Aggregatibacter kilianii]|uniref:hypothetical protein n=1 Tax=Aggregatibacter kilianii TaxID=2025884 RepID=UPI000D6413DF|nr:hypothetical protein [Aggregatibacter kilianii]
MDKESLLNIASTLNSNSLISILHNEERFDKKKFKELHLACDFYLKNESQFEKEIKKKFLLDIMTTFHHILFLFICDEDDNDSFQIKPRLDSEEKTNIYFEIRDITEKLFSS